MPGKLVEKLSDIQTFRLSEYRDERILRNKLLNAVKDVDSCQLAYCRPPDTVQGVISGLHASLESAERTISTAHSSRLSKSLEQFFDRRFVRGNSSRQAEISRSKEGFMCRRPNF